MIDYKKNFSNIASLVLANLLHGSERDAMDDVAEVAGDNPVSFEYQNGEEGGDLFASFEALKDRNRKVTRIFNGKAYSFYPEEWMEVEASVIKSVELWVEEQRGSMDSVRFDKLYAQYIEWKESGGIGL